MLTHRAICICSKSNLSIEMKKIRQIFQNNGYPSDVVEARIRQKMARYETQKVYGTKKQPVYLKLPYMGVASEKMVKSVRDSIKTTFYSVTFRVVFQTQSLLPATKKDHLPIYSKSNVIYEFKCKRCENVYIGRCYRRLGDRITGHIPASIRRRTRTSSQQESFNPSVEGISEAIKYYRLRSRPADIVHPVQYAHAPTSKSAVKLHLLENSACADAYENNCFRILATGRSKYHVDVLEGIFINTQKPSLCRQKEFVYNVKLFKS